MPRVTDVFRRAGMLAISATTIAITAFVTPAAAAVDYAGERITILVPFSEGGGTDSWTRMMAPYLEKTLPGNPKVIVLNRPGAGGITGANYYDEKAPRDGTMIFALSISTAMNYAFGDPRIKFKLEDYHPVLNSPRSSTQYVREDLGLAKIKNLKSKLKTLQELPPEKLNFGGRTPTSVDLTYRVGLSLLGIEVNSVWGLGGTGPMALAFERGEFQISAENTLAFLNTRTHMIESGLAQPLYTLGNYDADGNYGRDPALPNVPSFVEAYECGPRQEAVRPRLRGVAGAARSERPDEQDAAAAPRRTEGGGRGLAFSDTRDAEGSGVPENRGEGARTLSADRRRGRTADHEEGAGDPAGCTCLAREIREDTLRRRPHAREAQVG